MANEKDPLSVDDILGPELSAKLGKDDAKPGAPAPADWLADFSAAELSGGGLSGAAEPNFTVCRISLTRLSYSGRTPLMTAPVARAPREMSTCS